MFCNSIRIKTFIFILTVVLLPELVAQAQENIPTGQQGASVTLLDSTRQQDGLVGSVRRVKVQTAKLEMKAGRPVEGPLQLLELTTYSVGGNRIENISFPVPTTSVGKEEYKYDEKGHIVEMTLRGDDGSILSREKYTYELDNFGNWTKMVTSLIVFEDGQLKYEPVEVTYRTLAYYFNDTVAQIVDSDSRPVPVEPKGVTISNPAATKPHTEPPKTEPLLGVRRVGKKALGTNDEPRAIENVRETNSTVTGAGAGSPKFVTETTKTQASVPVAGHNPDASSVTEPRNVAGPANETTVKNTETTAKNTTPAVSAELKMAFEYYKSGREHFDSGAIYEAIDAYQKSIKLEPNSAEAHLSLGQAYLKLKQDEQALKSFKRATVLNTDMAEAFYGLGLIHFNRRHYKDAAKAFKQATVANPNLAKAHYGLALAYQELGDENAVVAEFRILETLDRGLARKLADTFPEFNLPCRVPPFCK
jgi:TolA-binding protein